MVSEIDDQGRGRPADPRCATPSASTPPPAQGSRSARRRPSTANTTTGAGRSRTARRLDHRLVVELRSRVRTGEETTLTAGHPPERGSGPHARPLSPARDHGRHWPVRTEPGLEITEEIIEIAATEPAGAQQQEQESLTTFYRRVAPELAPLRAALRAAELRKAGARSSRSRSRSSRRPQEPEPVRILPRGNWLDESGRGRGAGRSALPAPVDTARPARHAPRPRALADLAGQPAHRARLRQPAVEALLRPGSLPNARGPRLAGRVADPSRAARLAGGRVRGQRLGREAPGAHARDLRHLPADLARPLASSSSGIPTTGSTRASRASGSTPRWSATTRWPSAGCCRLGSAARASTPTSRAATGLISTSRPASGTTRPGEDQYRRGLYTWWQRTFPQPSLLAFDAPSREECVAERVRSNIPQQALVLLNDPTYVEAARVFAERILRAGGPSFRRPPALGLRQGARRGPPAQRKLASSRSSSANIWPSTRREPEEASRIVAAGLAPVPKELNVVELAAWTSVARAILNLPEVITRP